MSRSRWTPFLLALLAGAAWAAWRFPPRDWLRLGRGDARPEGGETIEEVPAAASGEAAAAEPARCAAVTQGGTRCSREPEAGSAYCWQHAAS